MADSPNKEKGALVRCSVYSEGTAVGVAFRLVSISVKKSVNRIGKAVLLYQAGDMPSASVPQSDDDTFAVGAQIRIEVGYGDDESVLFEGVVISHGVEIGRGNKGMLRVECRDYAFPTTQGRHSRVFIDSTDSAAIQAVLGEYSPLSPSVEGTTAKYGELVQYYSTDWDFVLSLADRNGMVATVEGKKITVGKPVVGGSPVLSLTYGPDIISFQADVSAEGQLSDIEASAWDPAKQESIGGKSKKPSLNAQGSDDATKLGETAGMKGWKLQTVGTVDADALANWADACRLRAGMSRIQGSVTFSGSAKAVAGSLIQLDGFGKHFDGAAYAGSVEHGIRHGNWETTVNMGLSAEVITGKRHTSAPAASGLLPGIGGLHIGKMVKSDGDPAKMGRIQIEIPTLNGDNNVVWARLASTWASSEYGSFIIPDAGDEVVVGFFNNDPCYPVVLGSIYSSSRKSPYELTAENNVRALVTKEKIKLIFDEKDKSVTIETPGNNRIVISDKEKGIALSDQNGNKIVMDKGGITIESAKELNLKAKTNIAADAGSAASIQAKSNLKLKGMNVEAKADASLVAKGTVSAEFSASGNTTLKGTMVMIN